MKNSFQREDRGRKTMLIDLNYWATQPSDIYSMISQINGIDLSSERTYFDHYATGIYRHDGYMFNFDGFINERCNENIADKWIRYGVCDNYEQILDKYKDMLTDSNKKYVIGLCTVDRIKQSSEGGWKWDGWGEYIGTQNPKHEYLYDDTHIDRVYCFHIYELV